MSELEKYTKHWPRKFHNWQLKRKKTYLN